jgi:glycosyltransferase involved in cell wall biosynthesis
MRDDEDPPKNSLVIMKFRRRAIVTRMVRGLTRQEFSEALEVIVIVDGSDDGSSELGPHGVA